MLRILDKFPTANVIEIPHYKDIFCRSQQNFCMQKKSPKLILAKKEGTLIYPGAPVCQDFGNKHFYYTSNVMNCIYDCEYCYLQGMYSSGNVTVFVNLEDFFLEIELLLQKHPVYLCISYDTDLLALEGILGYCEKWIAFAKKHKDLTIEIRTKSANTGALTALEPSDNVIFAWTLSPDFVSSHFEHKTPSLNQRLKSIKVLTEKGHRVRLCFDPIIYHDTWKESYSAFITAVFSHVPTDAVRDISLGVFRVSKDYLKRMRKQRKDSLVLAYPYEMKAGVYQYKEQLEREMTAFMLKHLTNHVPESIIFQWKECPNESNAGN
ncbi:SPL family radical SAM protein [Anaeromicropila populeti]|uniref:SPL family radical SAM protein n=1 Tax=Anaeromicropila populeti TaxID=37658 RepID=UPI001FA84E74|nr:radical SAM protein [Anaeromicropila populeti]